jgi:hypothetical protein
MVGRPALETNWSVTDAQGRVVGSGSFSGRGND